MPEGSAVEVPGTEPLAAVDRWLAAAAEAPERAGVFVDFDGTLAPIVDDPAAAAAHPEAARLLGRLSGRWGRVAVVSGRPAAFLQAQLAGCGATELVGLYGLEAVGGATPEIRTDPAAQPWRAAVATAASRAELGAPVGASVERKGLTVTLHYRGVPSGQPWAEETAAALERLTGLVAHRGKMSVELRPPIAVDKGTAVRDLAGGLSAVFFAGDDLGDLPAFAELARMREAGARTLGVAVAGAETPPAVVAAADAAVEGTGGVIEVLERLAAGGARGHRPLS